MELKVYQLTISDDEKGESEVNFVSLVDQPAIQRNFLAFKKQQKFAISSEDKRLVSGPAMVPDVPIYRMDDNGEYFIVFSADTIEKIAERFFKKGYQSNINLMHEEGSVLTDSVFFESWIVNRELGKPPMKGFEDMPDGTWFLTARINNPEIWEGVKSGEYKGFSVEGIFDYSPLTTVDPEVAIVKEIQEILQGYLKSK